MDAAEIAKTVAQILEENASFTLVDWNDLGEVTIQCAGRTFRGTFFDITDDDDD